MSQHYFNCKRNGHNVQVTLGYDRPLDYYFLNVEQEGIDSDEARESGEEVIEDGKVFYCSLFDVGTEGFDIDYFRKKLNTLGLTVPDSIFDAVEDDAAERVGNYIVEHFADGSTKVLMPKSAG